MGSARPGQDRQSHLLLEEILSVLEGAQLELLVLVLQLLLRGPEVEDEVLQGEHHGVHGQRRRVGGFVFPAQRIQTSGETA